MNLIFGTHTFTGDTLVWGYPGFYFFAQNLWNGIFPLWSPFSHGGEPFYPVLLQRRLLEPTTWLFVGLAKFFNPSPTRLFNWHLFFQSGILISGSYFLLRRYAGALWIRLTLQTSLFLSSYALTSFRQIGGISQFLWLPWLIHFTLALFWRGERSRRAFCGFALFLGLSCQSYWFSGSSVIVFLIALASLGRLWRLKSNLPLGRICSALALLAVFNLPNLAVYLEKDRFVYPLRMLPPTAETVNPMPLQTEGGPENLAADLAMDWNFVRATGSPGTVWDLLQTASPQGGRNSPPELRWGKPTAAFIYLGLWAWVLVWIGFMSGKSADKLVWGALTFGSAWLFLGPDFGLQEFLHAFFLPVRYLRHTLTFVVPLTLGLLYFLVLGANRLQAWREGAAFPRWPLYFLAAQLILVLNFHANQKAYFLDIAWRLVLPLGLFFFFGRRFRMIPYLVVGLLVIDLLEAREQWGVLYREQLDPFSRIAAPPDFSRPTLPGVRAASPVKPDVPNADDEQTIRYLAHLYRQPFALSEVFVEPDPINRPSIRPATFPEALAAKRWNAYHLLKSYFETLHFAKPSVQIADELGIGKTPFAAPGAQIKIENWSYNDVTLRLQTESPTQLIWQDAWDPHWQATIEGRDVPVQRNGFSKAVSVPAGESIVRFRYRPLFFLFACAAFWLAALVGAAGLLGWCRD